MPSQPIYWTEMAAGDNPNLNYKPRGATLGAPTEYNTGPQKYNTSGMMYPDDLMAEANNQYGNNYVIFYINVHEDSSLTRDGSASFIDPLNVAPRQSGAAAELSGTAAAIGSIGAAVIAKKITGGSGIENVTVKDVTVTAIASATVIAAVGGAKKEYKRQVKAIALHVPTDLTTRYSASWDAEGLAGASAIASVAENLGKAVSLNPVSIADRFTAAGQAAKDGASYGAGLALQIPGGQLLGKTTGTAANPKKEQLFKEVDYRTFTFTYQFFPRNAAEAANVRNIIKEFKLHMHPEFRSTSTFLYIYPSEFDIFYYQNGKENMNLHRHTSCVLTDLSVTYAPQGTFSTFADGMPTQINVQMTFKELALLTKDNIKDGF